MIGKITMSELLCVDGSGNSIWWLKINWKLEITWQSIEIIAMLIFNWKANPNQAGDRRKGAKDLESLAPRMQVVIFVMLKLLECR